MVQQQLFLPLSCTVLTMRGLVNKPCLVLPILCLVLLTRHVGAHGIRNQFGDVSDDDLMIDKLDEYLRSRDIHLRNYGIGHPPPGRLHNNQGMLEKIQFAVPPGDPRYYAPPRLPISESAVFEEEVPGPMRPGQRLDRGQPRRHLPARDPDPRPEGPARAWQEPSEIERRGPADTQKGLGAQTRTDAVDGDNQEEKAKKAKVWTPDSDHVNYLSRSQNYAQGGRAQPSIQDISEPASSELSDVYFTAIVAGCTAAAVCGVIGAGVCWYRLNKSHRAAADAEYPAYGVTGPNKDVSPSSGDRKLAQSAHMYHYQHQKQQMIALEKPVGGERHGSASDVDSEEEGEMGDYTVYECPGLAPTGEMEVKNPLFHDDPTPATPSMRTSETPQEQP
ncbi:uncharacterized protein LOC143027219 [Oratosquilla oratoria]|uniref:uncharacterized protein LOC143027219 n=1 Tax=Oratosquilla oratoria TaxID=337810 RepID=UPI003F75BC58